MDTNFLDGFVTRAVLAESLNVTPRTLTNYEKLPNGLPSMELGGKKYYRLESIRKWLDARERRPNPRRRAT